MASSTLTVKRKPINYDRDINAQQEREKKRQAVVFVSSFHPRGGVFCCSWRDGAGFFFSRRDGAGGGGFRGGTGRLFFFPRRDGVVFFFFSTGRDGAVFLFLFRGPGRDGCFWRWQFFWRDGAKSLHRPVKGGLNRPASRPCKALKISLLAVPRLSRNNLRFRVLYGWVRLGVQLRRNNLARSVRQNLEPLERKVAL